MDEARNPVAAQKAMLALDEGVQMLLDSPYLGVAMDRDPASEVRSDR